MSEIVTLHNNEPMTTSLAIAEGVDLEHKSVIQLIRKYLGDLQEFGSLAFEMRVMRKDGRGGEAGEFAYLNEQQATLLITYMRNSDIVRRFKIELVRAFYALRDNARLQSSASMPTSVSHRADHVVSATRCFNGLMRAAGALRLGQNRAALAANQAAIRYTGVDILNELGVEPEELPEDARRPTQDDTLPLIKAWLAAPEQVAVDRFTGEEIVAGVFDIVPGDPDYRSAVTRAGIALARLGWQHCRSTGPGRQYYYKRPG